MGRIEDPELQLLSAQWSQQIFDALNRIGREIWPPFKERRGLLAQSRQVIPYSVEGPTVIAGQLFWAVSHTTRPSAFDDYGNLTPGERAFWVICVKPGSPPIMIVDGAQVISLPLDPTADWQSALNQAVQDGPKVESFYGNKGPLSHR
jgi:hypothetical protein